MWALALFGLFVHLKGFLSLIYFWFKLDLFMIRS